MEYAYRFRTIESILGKHKELENRQIYFSTLTDLNDPMEGFRNIRWKGDAIAWQNLLRHFLLCLEHVYSYCLIAGINDTEDELRIPVFKTIDSLQTEKYKALFRDLKRAFFSDPNIQKMPQLLADRKTSLSRKELSWHLSTIHLFALSKIQETYREHALISPQQAPLFSPNLLDSTINEQIFSGYNQLSSQPESLDALVEVSYQMHEQTKFLARLRASDINSTPSRDMLIHTFVERYLKQIEQLLFSDNYIACFSKKHTNPSMWAHYADAHAGVCLKFKIEKVEGAYSINLVKNKSVVTHKLHPVSYKSEYPEIDFFRSIGRLSVSNLRKFWYSDELGQLSDCAGDVLHDQDSWRKNYWSQQMLSSTVKLDDGATKTNFV
jgi:hypothetical protein